MRRLSPMTAALLYWRGRHSSNAVSRSLFFLAIVALAFPSGAWAAPPLLDEQAGQPAGGEVAHAPAVPGNQLTASSSAGGQEILTPEQAQQLLAQDGARHYSAGLEARLRTAAGLLPRVSARPGSSRGRSSNPTNLQVNAPDPSGPAFATQSETMVIASGSTIVEAYNDSLAAAQTHDYTGYSVSTDGGASWTDKDAPPNPSFQNSFGDPALAKDSAGNIYLAMLTSSATGLGVARMPAGDSTFATWVDAGVGTTAVSDKELLAIGRDPFVARDNLYLTWTDFPFSGNPTLRAARSTDGGTTWHALSGFAVANCDCQFTFPLVVPSTGKLLVFWEDFGPPRALRMRSSTDGGLTWSAITTVSSVTQATPFSSDCFGRDTFHFPDSTRAVRNDENPSAAVQGTTVVVTWNDRRFGTSDILQAVSTDAGATWGAPSLVNTTTAGEQFQPAVAADARGFHFEWYSADAANTNITLVARDQLDGAFQPETTISAPFPVPLTNISGDNQDFAIVGCYMGDYNQNFADGTTTYYSWGDNRLSFSNGDPDPNAFFSTSGAPPCCPPGPVTVSDVKYGSVTLTWGDQSADETSFQVQRKRSGDADASYRAVSGCQAAPADSTSCTDYSVIPYASYVYRVCAVFATPPMACSPGTPPVLTYSRNEDTSPNVTYTGNWKEVKEIHGASCSGGTCHKSTDPRGSASLTWTGTDVQVISATGPMMGEAYVVVDGALVVLDLYRPTLQYQQLVYSATGLVYGRHTVKLSPSGARNPASSGTAVGLDAFDTR